MTRVVLIGFLPADRERLARLMEALECRGLAVDWWSEAPTKVQWSRELQRRIEAAPAVVVAWTRASVRDRWSALIAEEALERRALVSVVLDPVVPPSVLHEVPALSLVDWDGARASPGMDRLVTALALVLGLPPGFGAAAPTPPLGLVPEGPSRAPSPGAQPVPLHPPGSQRAPVAAPGVRVPAEAPQGRSFPGASVEPFRPRAKGPRGPEPGWGFLPCGWGWALAWAAGLVAMGLYLLPTLGAEEVARVYIGNLTLSAAGGAAVGLAGAASMLYALIRARAGVSALQCTLIAAAWTLSGSAGLLTAAWFGLPVLGVAAGLVGFDLGWVLCWIVAAALGGLATWLTLRASHPDLARRDLAALGGGFALGALGGWLLGWVLVAVPILPLDWLLGGVLPPGRARDLALLGVRVLGLGLCGLFAGAAYGVGGGMVLMAALERGGPAPERRAAAPGEGD